MPFCLPISEKRHTPMAYLHNPRKLAHCANKITLPVRFSTNILEQD